MSQRSFYLSGAAAAVLSLALAGCAAVTSFLNPDFLTAAGLVDEAAGIPGEAPAILVEVENRTGRTVEVLLTWRDADGEVETLINTLAPGLKLGQALICPIDELTLGDISDLTATGAVVRLGTGAADDPVVEVEPFGVRLQDGANYNCGDVITFAVTTSGATRSGYQIFAFIRRADS